MLGKQPRKKRRGCGCLLLIVGAVVALVIASVIYAALNPMPKAGTATATATPIRAVTKAPRMDKTSTPEPAATTAPKPTKTPKPTVTPDQKIQQRADFRDFYGHLAGIEALCTDANGIAQKALTDATADNTQMLTAYTSAQAAHDACDNAANDMLLINKPDSLGSFKTDEIVNASYARMGAIRDAWYDIAQALNTGSVTLSDQATLQGHTKDAQNDATVEEIDLAVIIATLHVDLKNIPPIAPS